MNDMNMIFRDILDIKDFNHFSKPAATMKNFLSNENNCDASTVRHNQ
jgi:hypothetical protein